MLNKLNELRNKNNREEGFTLIELIVVVVVIGIISAIAIPIFTNQQHASEKASVQSDVRRAADYLDNNFTVESGYPTTLGPIVASPNNTLTLFGGGNTGTVDNGTTTGIGNSGTTKPKTNRALTRDEFVDANLMNTGNAYQNFQISDSTATYGGGSYRYTFAYTGNGMASLPMVELKLTQACAYVQSQAPADTSLGMGKNNCYSLINNLKVSEAADSIKVVSSGSSSNTPAGTTGTSIASYNWDDEDNGYYVVGITLNPKSNKNFDGVSTTGSDITLYHISHSDTNLQAKSPNLTCLVNTAQGIAITEYNIGNTTFCGGLATMSNEVANSFWELKAVPTIPANLTPASAGSGNITGYCVEGHSDKLPNNEGWYYIDATNNKLTEGRCSQV